MDYIQRLNSLFSYYRSALTSYSIHSPFAYDFIESVLLDKKTDFSFDEIENVRKTLLKDHTALKRTDLGAGSSGKSQKSSSVSEIARKSLSPPKTGRMYYKMVKHYGYKSILELGTSLGISCLYLASACPEGKVVTIEGDPLVHKIAVDTGKEIGLNNINWLEGEFDSHLSDLPSLGAPFDLVLMDGNHSYEPTISYFEKLWPQMQSGGAIIVDDIHWSVGMTAAWNEIKENFESAFFFETWRFGIAFKSVAPANGPNIKWIPGYLKPWSAGFFK